MLIRENYIVFPEGELQEIDTPLSIDALVDLNGRPLALPIPSPRMIAYRVVKIRRREGRGSEASYHFLELVPASELIGYT
jgi:hypothetical protein